jgi:Fe-S cluster biogenesis protein NfuA
VDSGHDTEGTTPEVDSGGLADANNAATADSDVAVEVPAELSDEDRAERLTQLNGIIELMRPAVQADGGDLALVSADVASGVIEVQLQGACSSCAVSSSTLQGGVERILHDRLPWVTEVLGGVDESVDPFESESMGRGGYVPSF